MQHISTSIREVTAMYDLTVAESRLLTKAAKLLSSKLRVSKGLMTSPDFVKEAARTYFTLTHSHKESEVLSVMYLDNGNQLIEIADVFFGTIDGAMVHPRIVVRQAIQFNAAAVIIIHNHPSGEPNPSESDKRITRKLQDALALIDVRVLDHIVIGGMDSVSFAEYGYI